MYGICVVMLCVVMHLRHRQSEVIINGLFSVVVVRPHLTFKKFEMDSTNSPFEPLPKLTWHEWTETLNQGAWCETTDKIYKQSLLLFVFFVIIFKYMLSILTGNLGVNYNKLKALQTAFTLLSIINVFILIDTDTINDNGAAVPGDEEHLKPSHLTVCSHKSLR